MDKPGGASSTALRRRAALYEPRRSEPAMPMTVGMGLRLPCAKRLTMGLPRGLALIRLLGHASSSCGPPPSGRVGRVGGLSPMGDAINFANGPSLARSASAMRRTSNACTGRQRRTRPCPRTSSDRRCANCNGPPCLLRRLIPQLGACLESVVNERDFEGTLVLDQLAAIGRVDDFFDAFDSDDVERPTLLMKSAKIDARTIAMVVRKMEDSDSEH